MKTKTLVIVLLTIFVFIPIGLLTAGTVLYAIFNPIEPEVTKVEEVASIPQYKQPIFREEIKDNSSAKEAFMLGCMETDYSYGQYDQQSMCECTYDDIIATHGLNWLLGLEDESQTQIESEVQSYAVNCALQYM
jgi:hypothetical protein